MSTKLTLTLPDELRRRAGARAASEGTTVSAVIRRYLEGFAAELDLLEAAADARAARSRLAWSDRTKQSTIGRR